MSSPPQLPPFSSVLKSRDVEDPVNIYVHRPLAYAFVKAVYRTSLTPNAVTLLAMLVGMMAGAAWIYGTPQAMVVGGVLLWASAILDGADGILARAKQMTSELGRALDGSADMVVAISTVLPAFAHIYVQHRDPVHVLLAIPALLLTLPHLYLYDYYKESYLRMTRPGRGGEGADLGAATAKLGEMQARAEGLSPFLRFVYGQIYLPYLQAQVRLVGLTNRPALREGRDFVRDERTAEIYRRHNAAPMKAWTIVSLAPHSYLMAICGMFDRLDVYLFIRLFAMNAVFVVVLLWQRRATLRTLQELEGVGTAPAVA